MKLKKIFNERALRIMKEDKENIVKKKEVPKFTWIVLLVIGCIDLFRGIMHTIFIGK